jgi:hypothetical protein
MVVDHQVNLQQFMHMVVVLEELALTVLVKMELQVVQVAAVAGVMVHLDPVAEVMVVEIQEVLAVGMANLEVVRHTVLLVVVVQVVPAVITVVVMVAQAFLVL